MSNSRQFLVPTNYGITKPIYPRDEIVRKRQYFIDHVGSSKQYYENSAKIDAEEANVDSNVYADKLRRRGKH